MPYTIRTKDGILISGIPDEIPKDSQQVKDMVAARRAQLAMPSAGMTTAAAQEPQEPPPASSYLDEAKGLAQAALRGVAPVAGGAATGAGMGFIAGGPPGAAGGALLGAGSVIAGDLVTNLTNMALGTNYQSPSDAMQALLTKMGVKEPQTESEKMLKAISEGAAGALGGAAGAKLFSTASSPAVSQAAAKMAAQPGVQAAMGATGAAGGEIASQAAASAGLTPEAQLVAGLAGGIAGGAAGAPLARMGVRAQPSPTQIEQLRTIQAGERAGIPIMTTDIMPSTRAVQRFQQVSEAIPIVGTAGARKVQQEARKVAAEKLATTYGAVEASEQPLSQMTRDLIDTRKQKLSGFVNQRDDAISTAAKTGAPFKADRTIAAAVDKLVKLQDEYGDLEGASQAKAVLRNLVDKLKSAKGQDISFIQEQRKILSDFVEQPMLTQSLPGAQKALNDVYGAMKQDILGYVGDNAPQKLDQLKSANASLSGMARELKSFPMLKNILDTGEERPEVIARMLNSNERAVNQKLYSSLSPAGQAAMRAAIVSDVAKASGGLENINPDRFASNLKRKGQQIGVAFKGDDLDNVKALQRAIKATVRAAGDPKTGIQAIPTVLATSMGASLGVPTTLAVVATAGAMARAFESPATRALLVKFQSVKPNSPEELELARNVFAAMTRAAAQETQPSQ